MLLVGCITTSAQTNPKPGYIITNDKDTIYGTIDFRTNDMNAKQCSFKANDKTDYTTYLPGEIEGYRFTDNGKFYVSRKFEDRGLFFAEYIVKGQLSLYRYLDSWTNMYYIETEDGKIIPFKEDKKSLNRDDLGHTDDVVKKAQRLYAEVSRSPQAREDIKPGYMTEKRLIQMVEDYHADMCTTGDECIVFQYDDEADKEPISFEVSAGAGYGIWNKDFMLDSYSYLDVKSSFVWTAGLGINIDATRKVKNLLIQVSLNYTNQNTTGSDSEGIVRDVKANSLSLHLGPLFRFGEESKPKYTVRVGWMPTFYWVSNEYGKIYKGYNRWDMEMRDDSQLHMMGAYAGVGYEMPMADHALAFNLEYRSGFGFGVHHILGTVSFRF